MATHHRPLLVGVQLPEVERVVRWPELKAMSLLIDQAGFDAIWVGDHLLYPVAGGEPAGPWEAWSSLAAIAAVTESVRLGPLVAATSFHNPGMIAKKAAAIDEISGGRLIVGLGAGWAEAEYNAFGYPHDHRVSRFEEAFTIIRRLLRQEMVDFNGKYYQTKACEILPKSLRPEGPPIMVGSMGPRMLRITLPYVQMWNAWYAWFGNNPEGLKPLLDQLDAACREVDRDPSDVARTVSLLVQAPGGTGRNTGDAGKPAVDPIRGSPQQVAEAIEAFAEIGIAEVQLVIDPITIEAIEWTAQALAVLDR